MSLIKELAKELIEKNPPEAPKDYDVEKLKRLAKIKEAFKKPCVEHHWTMRFGNHRCRYCGMKYSYWLDVKAAVDRGDVKMEDWCCKPHHHSARATLKSSGETPT